MTKHIKTLLGAFALAAVMVPVLASDAAAWTCHARSPTGSWGWGSAGSIPAAQRRALYECAVRTPRGYVCRITRCR